MFGTNSLYTKKTRYIIRFFSLVVIAFIAITLLRVILIGSDYHNSKEFFGNTTGTIILDTICLLAFTFLFIFPEKYIAVSIVTFLYAITIFTDEPNNPMGIIMSFLCYFSLNARNFFNKHKLAKNIIFFSSMIIAFICEIRFGINIFLNSFFFSFALLLTILFILFFYKNIVITNFQNNYSTRILNIKPFSGTRKEDIQLLELILQNKTYKEISAILFRAEGTIRNRSNKLYDIIGVADRIGFITTYAGYKITYQDEVSITTAENNQVSSIKKKSLFFGKLQ